MPRTPGPCRPGALLCVFALLAAPGGGGPLAAVLPEAPAWTQLQDSSTKVFSQADEEQTRRIASALSEFRRALPYVAKDLAAPDRIPIVVFAFRNPEAMRPYEPAGLESNPGLLGGFYLGDRRNGYVGLRAYLPGNPLETVFHELVHAAQFRNYETLPLWLQEGQADYYSTLRVSGGRVEVGAPPAMHVLWFHSHAPTALRELFGVTSAERARFREDAVLNLYATSWAFVHFLRHTSPARRAMLEKYEADLVAGVAEAKAHLAAFGVDLAPLETAFREYVANANFVSEAVEIPEPPPAAAAPLVPAPRHQLLAELGRMLAAPTPPNLAAAEEHLRAALALAPEDPTVLSAWGALEYRKQRCKEGAAYYRKAVAAGATPVAWLLDGAAALLCLPTEPSIPAVTTPPKDDPEERAGALLARDWLRRGLAELPDDVPALAAFGLTYVMVEDAPAEGIAALEKALRLAPRRGDIAWNLMELYLNAGEPAKARALVDGVITAQLSRADVTRARRELLQRELERAVALVNARHYDEGIALLAKLAAEEPDPETRQKVAGELERVRAHVARQKELDAYNAAADLARAGKAAEALRAFRKLVAECKDPEVCERAREAERRLTSSGVRP